MAKVVGERCLAMHTLAEHGCSVAASLPSLTRASLNHLMVATVAVPSEAMWNNQHHVSDDLHHIVACLRFSGFSATLAVGRAAQVPCSVACVGSASGPGA